MSLVGAPASDPAAAPSAAARQPRRARVRLSLGWAPVLALAAAGGLLLIAFGNNAAREQADSAPYLFWGGLVLIYAPIAFRLLSDSASRAERITLVLVLGLSLFVVKILAAPTAFVRFDELGTWRATNDVIQTGGLLSYNPLVISTSAFPGLEAVTAALSQLGHLSIFHSGLIVIGAARAALMVALFLFLERVAGSPRAAGIGVAVYACNPSFLYFDSQFGYESLALTLAAALLLLTLRWTEATDAVRAGSPGGVAAIAVLACALTVTHHMTAFAMLAFLALWAYLVLLRRSSEATAAAEADGDAMATSPPFSWTEGWTAGPALAAALLGVAIVLWFTFHAASVTVEELGNVIGDAFDSAINLISGGRTKEFFQGGGETNSLPLRILAFAAVVPLLAVLPFGLRRTWFGRDPNPLWRALALVAVLFPVTLGLRLTAAGSEVSQRASEFTFLGVAFLGAIVIGGLRWPSHGWSRTAIAATLSATATIVFLGGVVLGELPATRQPGPFVVGADARSITPQGLNAAEFAAEHLPPGSRVISDRSNGMLLASYGGLDLVLGRTGGIRVPRVLFSRRWGPADRIVIRDQRVDYILVDRRLVRDVPAIGFYIENDEPQAFTREEPISREAVAKFAGAKGLQPIFDNGPITIYDTSGLGAR